MTGSFFFSVLVLCLVMCCWFFQRSVCGLVFFVFSVFFVFFVFFTFSFSQGEKEKVKKTKKTKKKDLAF